MELYNNSISGVRGLKPLELKPLELKPPELKPQPPQAHARSLDQPLTSSFCNSWSPLPSCARLAGNRRTHAFRLISISLCARARMDPQKPPPRTALLALKRRMDHLMRGRVEDSYWLLLGRSWSFLGALGRSCGALGRSWVGLGRSWAALGRSWGGLGRFGGALGTLLGAQKQIKNDPKSTPE